MARLESTARAGYFACPPRVAAAIARHLTTPERGGKRNVRLFDPCAGTGEAAAVIASALGAETFGVEINEERAAAAATRLDHVLTTSAFSIRLANGAFSVLYLNPPYDQDPEKQRLEHAFLTALTRALCAGGVLVLVVPQVQLAVSALYLASHYAGFAAYRFPDPEFAAFRQAVLFAVRKPQPAADAGWQARIEEWSRSDLAPLPDQPDERVRLVPPALPAGDVLFASLFFDPAQAATEARKRGAWTQPQLAEQVWPPDDRPVRPLMPLRRGHLALLIAAGMLNNVVLADKADRVLVKGRTRKELVRVDADDDATIVEREVLRTTVVALDLASGAFQTVEQGAGGGDAGSRAQ